MTVLSDPLDEPFETFSVFHLEGRCPTIGVDAGATPVPAQPAGPGQDAGERV